MVDLSGQHRRCDKGIKLSWIGSKLRESDLDEIQIEGECFGIGPTWD